MEEKVTSILVGDTWAKMCCDINNEWSMHTKPANSSMHQNTSGKVTWLEHEPWRYILVWRCRISMHFHACLPSPKESRPTILFQRAHDTITTTMHYYKGSPLKLPYIHLTLVDPPQKKNMGPLKNQPMFRALKKRKKKNERLYSYSQGTELCPSMSHEHKRPWPHSLKPNPVDPGQGGQTGPARTLTKNNGNFLPKGPLDSTEIYTYTMQM